LHVDSRSFLAGSSLSHANTILHASDRRMGDSLLLVHGAGSGPWVFEGWAAHFPNLAVEALDLHAGRDVGRASMNEYGDAVAVASADLPRPLTLLGWSMGGLVALMAAERVRRRAVVVLESSPHGEDQGFHLEIPLVQGVFDPREIYGPFPAGMPSRPESSLARPSANEGSPSRPLRVARS